MKMIDSTLTLEGLFSVVLYGVIKTDKSGVKRFVFETQNSGDNTCKTPKGMFDTPEIPNSLALVKESMDKYYNEEEN